MISRKSLKACILGSIPSPATNSKQRRCVIMTENQKLFCDEYLIDLNGTRAYRTVYKTIKN